MSDIHRFLTVLDRFLAADILIEIDSNIEPLLDHTHVAPSPSAEEHAKRRRAWLCGEVRLPG